MQKLSECVSRRKLAFRKVRQAVPLWAVLDGTDAGTESDSGFSVGGMAWHAAAQAEAIVTDLVKPKDGKLLGLWLL